MSVVTERHTQRRSATSVTNLQTDVIGIVQIIQDTFPRRAGNGCIIPPPPLLPLHYKLETIFSSPRVAPFLRRIPVFYSSISLHNARLYGTFGPKACDLYRTLVGPSVGVLHDNCRVHDIVWRTLTGPLHILQKV